MTERELQKEFLAKWKKENPQKSGFFLIAIVADIVLAMIVLVILFQQPVGISNKKIASLLIIVAVSVGLGIIRSVVAGSRTAEWKQYLEKNRNRLK